MTSLNYKGFVCADESCNELIDQLLTINENAVVHIPLVISDITEHEIDIYETVLLINNNTEMCAYLDSIDINGNISFYCYICNILWSVINYYLINNSSDEPALECINKYIFLMIHPNVRIVWDEFLKTIIRQCLNMDNKNSRQLILYNLLINKIYPKLNTNNCYYYNLR